MARRIEKGERIEGKDFREGREIGAEESRARRARYEITVYKLMVIIIIGLFVAIGIGLLVGEHIGETYGVNKVQLPEYCAMDFSSGKAVVNCNELPNMTVRDLCAMLSTPLESRIRILIAA